MNFKYPSGVPCTFLECITAWPEWWYDNVRDFISHVRWHMRFGPFKRGCPVCGGSGIETTETRARYDVPGDVCGTCRGKGWVKR